MKSLLPIATAALLFAAGSAQAQIAVVPYRAHGTEPFWNATIDARSLRFALTGERPIVAPKPRPIVGFNGERYVTPRLTIDVTHTPCNDGTNDRRYHDTVTVSVGRRSFRGCGGGVIEEPQTTLIGNWRVLSINGRPTLERSPATIRFDGDRVSGNTGCNAFGGSFRLERGQLSTGPMMSTKRACVAPSANGQERALLGFFGDRASVSQGSHDRLVLTARTGGTLVIAPDAELR
jgi:heat shock protein HslJ